MSMRAVKKGATDQSVVIRIIDSADGTPENAVEHNTSGIDLWYRREGATKTSITEAALSALNDAHSDGGIELIGDGYYRLDAPDAAFATGANGVLFGGTVTGMIVIGCYVPLVDYDPQDTVRLGLTALPNAAADAAGGLPISDAGGLDIDTLLSRLTGNVATAAKMLSYFQSALRKDVTVDSDIGGNYDDATDSQEAIRDNMGTAQTGDSFARLGAPVGASLSADVAGVKTQTAAIEADTQDIQSRIPAALTGDGNMKSDAKAVAGVVLQGTGVAGDKFRPA